jgi:hypothetical protein
MIVMMLAAAFCSASARADEDVAPPSLIGRALRLRAYEDQDRTRAAAIAPWIPQLRVHAIVERAAGSLGHDNTIVMGELAWPLGRSATGDLVLANRARRQASAERQRLLDRIGDAWHRRRQASDREDDLAATLDLEEADAELDAITGRDAGDDR